MNTSVFDDLDISFSFRFATTLAVFDYIGGESLYSLLTILDVETFL